MTECYIAIYFQVVMGVSATKYSFWGLPLIVGISTDQIRVKAYYIQLVDVTHLFPFYLHFIEGP
jgi:hypothetical protein